MNENDIRDEVRRHYSVEGLTETILSGLSSAESSAGAVDIAELAPVDAFHIRGREATDSLAERVGFTREMRVLDVGSGIGGTARFLADRFGVHVTGVDLTEAYCETATALSERAGFSERTAFQSADATRLPFEDASFDVVWTEHVQMNIEDEVRFYDEMIRVLRPGGLLAFHDIFVGANGGPRFPVPWAEVARLSHLRDAAEVRALLEERGLEARAWYDETRKAARWFRERLAKMQGQSAPPTLGLHLLMGATARTKFENVLDGLENGRLVTVQAVFAKDP